MKLKPEPVGKQLPEHEQELFPARGTRGLCNDLELIGINPCWPSGDLIRLDTICRCNEILQTDASDRQQSRVGSYFRSVCRVCHTAWPCIRSGGLDGNHLESRRRRGRGLEFGLRHRARSHEATAWEGLRHHHYSD